jgi:hypothetical protein
MGIPWSCGSDTQIQTSQFQSARVHHLKNREIRPEFFSLFTQKLDQDPKHKTSRWVVVVVVIVELGAISRIVQEHDLVSTCAELSAVTADEISTKARISVQRLTSYVESSGRRILLIT